MMKKRLLISMKARENTETIPTDLIIEILSRLSAKSIARCRCVSKQWDSMLRLPCFTESFLTKSCARPQLLFICQKHSESFFFSAPQVHNPSPPLAASFHMKFASDSYSEICGSITGLVCLTHLRMLKGRNETVPFICNPSTGQSLPLSKVKTNRVEVYSFLGYDPIGKEYKVLSMSRPSSGIIRISNEHQVLSLGGENPSWRMVECSLNHKPLCSGICIDGVLYYTAAVKRSSWVSLIVSFDIRSEKFRFIEKDEGMILLIHSVLINYKGKLGAITAPDGLDNVTGETKCFEMWVLEDAEKHEWSKHVYGMPLMWKNVILDAKLCFVGVTSTNEIVLSPRCLSDPFFVFYYNIEKKTIRRVEIQGMDAFKDCKVHTFVDHVENVKLLQML